MEDAGAGAGAGVGAGAGAGRAQRRNSAVHRVAAGHMRLEQGDVVLLEAKAGFAATHAFDAAFLLVREVQHSTPPRRGTCMDTFRVVASTAAVLGMVAASAVNATPLLVAALLAAAALVLTKCIKLADAMAAVNGRVLLAIVSAFGLAAALHRTGVAGFLAVHLVTAARPLGPYGVLVILGLLTCFSACVVSNNATVVILFPIAFRTVVSSDGALGFREVIAVLMTSASLSFASPIGYQTNLLVLGPGGYSFGDFARFGAPLQVGLVFLAAAVARLWFGGT